MRIIFKRILSVVLTVVMILTAVPFSSYATENEATVEQGNDDVSVSATNSLGAMITETLEDENLGVDSDYVITDLSFEGDTATVSYMALDNCNLVVAVYDENTMQMLTSEVLILSSDEVSATVTFIDALPEFFIAKAFLVDLDYAPLCKEYISRKNTTEFFEFMETKSTDFEEDKVINLDNNEDNNFLVLDDGAQKIKGDEETNVLVSSDVETNTYMFENIDSSISSLKKGDVFHLDNGDMENLVVIKVASITIDGTAATIVAEASSLEEVFEFVKLDSDELKYNVSTDSAESGIIAEDGSFEADAWENTNEGEPWTKTEFYSFKEEDENEKGDKVLINGSATFTLAARYKIYIDTNFAEISFILNPSAVLTVTVSGSLKEREIKLGHIYFGMYGVTIGAEPVLVLSASGSITLTGTWKTQIGFAFNTKDGFSNKSKSATFEPEVNITGEFYVGFNLSPYLSFLRAKNSSVVDIKFKTEIGVTVKATYSNTSGHACLNCIDGDLLWSAKLDVDLAILYGLIDTSENKNYKKDLWNKKPTKFKDFYYSFDHSEFGWGECPYVGQYNKSGVVSSGICGEKLTWTLYKDGEMLIKGTGPMYDFDPNEFPPPWKENYRLKIYTVTICDGVTSIGNYAFNACHNLDKITLGNNVISIGGESFSHTDITSVNIPDSVISIGKYAFYLNNELRGVSIGAGVRTIEYSAFGHCKKLSSIIISDNVITIEDRVFDSCYALSSVHIGSGVCYFGESVFCMCLELDDLYYNGTESQWKAISNNLYISSDVTLHFKDTDSILITDSFIEFVVNSATVEIIDNASCCFETSGLVGKSYTLVTVPEKTFIPVMQGAVPLVLSNENVLYFDLVVANDCGMISTDFLPKAQVEGSVTLLIGDFGNGTEARVVTTTTYTPGDINLDTSFDGMDAIVVACVVNGMLTEEQIGTKKFEIADANIDGVIDTLDVTYLENKGLYLS